MSFSRNLGSFTVGVALLALAPLSCLAQSNAPLTSDAPAPVPTAQMPDRPVVQQVQTPMPQPAAPAAAAAPEPQEAFGDVTRGLLAAQADGRRAGAALPVLGPVSTAAWNRYLESFSRPIPEWFQKRVDTKNTN